jgi:hypothetical protein
LRAWPRLCGAGSPACSFPFKGRAATPRGLPSENRLGPWALGASGNSRACLGRSLWQTLYQALPPCYLWLLSKGATVGHCSEHSRPGTKQPSQLASLWLHVRPVGSAAHGPHWVGCWAGDGLSAWTPHAKGLPPLGPPPLVGLQHGPGAWGHPSLSRLCRNVSHKG